MRTKCYSVRLESLTPSKSSKAYLAKSYNGLEDWIPSQFIFGRDYDVSKSEAWWIAAWILERKNIQYSTKKEAWFNSETGKMLPTYVVKKHTPTKVTKEIIHDKNLER